MELPPAQESPHHIINALNDYCIQEILRRLDRIDDFINASRTCTRFLRNAISCYPRAFEGLIFSNRLRTGHVEFLSHFGHMISNLSLCGSSDASIDKQKLETIVRYCGKTLKCIEIKKFNSIICIKRIEFTALQKLKTNQASIEHFEYLPQLRDLHISNSQHLDNSQVLPIRNYPKLERLTVKNIETLTNIRLAKFLACNRQLTELNIKSSNKLTPSIFKYIAKYTPNIVTLSIISNRRDRVVTPHDIVMQLGTLNKLKCLMTTGFLYVSLSELINTLAANDVPIEMLLLQSVPFVDQMSNNMQTLKQLKTIRIHGFISDELISNFIRSQIALQKIQIFTFNSIITLHAIEQAFIYGKHLSQLSFTCFNKNPFCAMNQRELILNNRRVIVVQQSTMRSGCTITNFMLKPRVYNL